MVNALLTWIFLATQLRSWFDGDNKLDKMVASWVAAIPLAWSVVLRRASPREFFNKPREVQLGERKTRRWLEAILVSLHDIQLSSGIAISLAAVVGAHQHLSVYHMSIAMDLVCVAVGSQTVAFLQVRQ